MLIAHEAEVPLIISINILSVTLCISEFVVNYLLIDFANLMYAQ